MKVIINYIGSYIKEHFNLKLYISFTLFTAGIIFLNYYFDYEDSIIDPLKNYNQLILYTLSHAFGFYAVCLFSALITGRKKFLSNPSFWIVSITGFLILGFDRSFNYHHFLCSYVPYYASLFVRKIFNNLNCIWSMIIPLYILYLLIDRKRGLQFYGLTFRKIPFPTYVILLLIVVPLIFAASFLPDFIDYYPVYKRCGGYGFASFMNWQEWVSAVVFEFFYAMDFISVELFFRGFLVIGLVRFMGKDVILPMAATYAILHFGKPVGETISSVFGGYVLGIIALYSRNIWGGIFVHVGVALLMETFAFIRIY